MAESKREYINLKLVGFLAYSKFVTPDEYKGRKSYQTTVFISDEQAKKLKAEYGITAAVDKEKAVGFTAGNPAFKGGFNLATRRYIEQGEVKVTDAASGDDLREARIGNGTKAIVDVTIGNDSAKQGKTLWLNNVVIKDLVEYTSGGAANSDAEDEFEALFG